MGDGARLLTGLVALVASCQPARGTAPVAGAVSASTSVSVEVPPSPGIALPAAPPPPPAPRELPGGGRTVFPARQLVGFCGTPGAPALGPLQGNLSVKTARLQSYADQYAGTRAILPVLELIAVVVQGSGGEDGKYRRRVFDATVDEYLQAARDAHALLLLNIQPGRSDFLSEVRRFDRYLPEPDVGVALDPEWAMRPKETPNKFFGQTTGDAVNAVAEYLSAIVSRHDLPEKVLVYHQVNGYVVKDEARIRPYPGVALVKSVDGWGPKGTKIITYNYLMKNLPAGVHPGFKLFFDEDRTNGGVLMTPPEVMKLLPTPEYVMYE